MFVEDESGLEDNECWFGDAWGCGAYGRRGGVLWVDDGVHSACMTSPSSSSEHSRRMLLIFLPCLEHICSGKSVSLSFCSSSDWVFFCLCLPTGYFSTRRDWLKSIWSISESDNCADVTITPSPQIFSLGKIVSVLLFCHKPWEPNSSFVLVCESRSSFGLFCDDLKNTEGTTGWFNNFSVPLYLTSVWKWWWETGVNALICCYSCQIEKMKMKIKNSHNFCCFNRTELNIVIGLVLCAFICHKLPIRIYFWHAHTAQI